MSKEKQQIAAKIAALKEEYIETARREMSEEFGRLFAAYPELKSIEFKAYTRYFNDGDECNYYARTDSFSLNDCEDDDEIRRDLIKESREEIGYGENRRPNPDYNPESAQIVEEVSELLGSFDDETWYDIVGDHVRVIITAKGIETKNYTDHE